MFYHDKIYQMKCFVFSKTNSVNWAKFSRAKLSVFKLLVPNCHGTKFSWCQIVRFYLLVPNCPFLTLAAKLSNNPCLCYFILYIIYYYYKKKDWRTLWRIVISTPLTITTGEGTGRSVRLVCSCLYLVVVGWSLWYLVVCNHIWLFAIIFGCL